MSYQLLTKRLTQITFSLLVAYCIPATAQTGPGGVGTSTNNILWLRADQGTSTTTNGNPVSFWNDISGNANHSEQATGDNQPIYISSGINGFPTIRFDGSNDYLTVPDNDNLDNTNGVSVFVVAQPNTPDALPRGLVSKRVSAGNQESYYLFTYTNQYLFFNARGNRINGNDAITNQAQVFSAVFDGTIADPRSKVYYNGTFSGDGNGPTTIGNMASDLHIGILNPGYAQGFRGDISEAIVYRSALNAAEIIVVENYLASRYNITIGTNYYTNSTYNKSVVGIGTTDGTVKISETSGSGGGILLREHSFSLNSTNEFLFAGNNGTAAGEVATDLPTLAEGSLTGRSQKVWYIQKTITDGIDAGIGFQLSETGLGEGVENQVFFLLYRAGTSGSFSLVPGAQNILVNGRVWFSVSDADLTNGYYTIARSDRTGKTWYTYRSGNWNDWQTWSLEAGGDDIINPDEETPITSPTSLADKVVITTGYIVTVTDNNLKNVLLDVRGDGKVDFGSTSGHVFDAIVGNGTIRLSDDNFPTGDASGFADGTLGGTVEYYGAGYNLNVTRTFCNMRINLDNPNNQLILLTNYVLNGNLTVENGELHFGTTSTQSRTFTVNQHVVIEENGKIRTGTGDARHQFNLYGDFTNYGNVQFTNRVAVDYENEATNGIVDVNFRSATRNQNMMLEGPTRFYRIAIEKGLTTTYELYMEATEASNFSLFGYASHSHPQQAQLTVNNNAFGLAYGTVRIGPNISIGRLNQGGNYNVSENAVLWVDGGSVTKPSGTGEAVVVYGKIKVSSGTFTSNAPSGITSRLNGVFESTGGTTVISQFRTSVYGTQHIGGYIQTGGDVTVNGTAANTNYYSFTLSYEGNVFILTGGTMTVNGTNSLGAIFINSDPVNVNVSANATMNLVATNATPFRITSRTPLPTVNLNRSGAGTREFILVGGRVGTSIDNWADLPALPLVTKGSLTINSDITFDPRGEDVTIGRSFTIGSGASYNAYSNTTTFSGATTNYTIFINAAATTKYFHNLAFNNPGYTGTLNTSDITIGNNLTITAGTFATGDRTVTVRGNITNSGTITSTSGRVIITQRGRVHTINLTNGGSYTAVPTVSFAGGGGAGVSAVAVFNGTPTVANPLPIAKVVITNTGSGYTTAPTVSFTGGGGATATSVIGTTHELGGNGNGVFGNLEINEVHPSEAAGKMEVTYISAKQNVSGVLTLTNGILDIRTYNFVLSGTLSSDNEANYSETRLIRTSGNHSDGGFTRTIPSDGTYLYPLGTFKTSTNSNRYGWAKPTFSSVPVGGGDVQINGVPKKLPTLAFSTPDRYLAYYWRVRSSGFSSTPNVQNQFLSYENDYTWTGNFNNYLIGKVIGYNRYADGNGADDLGTLDNPAVGRRLLNYSVVKPLEVGEFTAAFAPYFNGSVRVFYLYRNNQNWNVVNTWSTTRGVDVNTHNDYPRAGDIAVIRRTTPGEYSGIVNVTVASAAAQVTFDAEGAWSSGCPRIVFSNTAAFGSNFEIVNVASTHSGGVLDGETHGAVIKYDLQDGYAGEFPAGDFGAFNQYINALVIYTKEGTTSSVTLSSAMTEYPQVWFDPQTSPPASAGPRTFILPDANVTFNGMVIVTYSHILRMNTGANASAVFKKRLNIGHSFGTGYFEFAGNATANQTATFETNINLYNNGQLRINSPAGGGRTHLLKLHGNITMETGCSINLGDNNPANSNVTLELTGEGTNSLVGAGSASVILSRITMNKGSSQDQSFTFNWPFTLNGPTDGDTNEKAIQLQNGRLILNNSGININLSTGGGDFYIPSTAGLVVQAGTVNVSGANNGILLDGLLRVQTGGTINMDCGSGVNNYIEYSSSGSATIEVTGGTLTVGSQIRRGTSNPVGILRYTQTGGTVVVGKNAAPVANRGTFEVLNDGSRFIYTAGTLTVVRPQSGATEASVLLEPATGSAGNTTIQIGNADTPPGSIITIKSSLELGNLTIGGPSTTARLKDRDLTVKRDLTIGAGCSFSGFDGINYRNLTVKRHIVNNGTANLNVDNLYLSGTSTSPSAAMQEITGNVRVNNLVVEPETSVTLQSSSNIEVDGSLTISSGQLIDGGNTITVKGNVVNTAAHISSGSGKILFSGAALQTIDGTGQFGNIQINKSAQEVRLLNSITLNQNLTLTNGRFNIQAFRLSLGQSANILDGSGTGNMIVLNGGFGDLGIQKTLRTGGQSFTLPMGVVSGLSAKYTPVDFNISENGNVGTFSIHPVDQAHMTADCGNVLQYYWNVTSSGLSGFEGIINFHFDPGDVVGTVTDYYRARLVGDSWSKTAQATGQTPIQDEIAQEDRIEFSFEGVSDIGGDYTAGTNACIPDNVPVFVSKQSGEWSNPNNWTREGGGIVPDDGPQGHIVRILSGHTITMDRFRIRSYKTIITGRLEVGTNIGHNLGFVSGSGTLAMVNEKLYPGDYSDFLACGTGGTMEFGGAGSYTLPSITSYNSLTVTGGGTKTLPSSASFNVCKNLTIKGTTVFVSPGTQNLYIGGDLTKEAGARFDPNAGGKVFLNGSFPQTVSGTFNAPSAPQDCFHNLEITNASGVTFTGAFFVASTLTLTSGVVSTTNNVNLSWKNTGSISGGSTSSYIEGPLRRRLPNLSTQRYPIGRGGKYKLTNLIGTSVDNQYWRVEYFDASAQTAGANPANFDNPPLGYVSQSEYWIINGPNTNTSNIQFSLTGTSEVAAALGWANRDKLRIVRWNSVTSKWEIVGGEPVIPATPTNLTNTTITSGSAITFNGTNQIFTLASTVPVTIPTAWFTTTSQSICAGTYVTLEVALTGNSPWEITYSDGGPDSEWITVNASPFTLGTFTPAVNTTYTLKGVREKNNPSNIGVISGSPVTITVFALPEVYTVTGGGEICGAGTGSVGLDNSQTGFTYQLYLNSSTLVGTRAGSNDNPIEFTGLDEVGFYTIRAYNNARPSCTEWMDGEVEIALCVGVSAELTALISNATICEGQPVTLEITFSGTPPFTFSLGNNQGQSWLNQVAPVGDLVGLGPYTYIFTVPDPPVWVGPNPLTLYSYEITAVSDGNSVVGAPTGDPIEVNVWKIPETGPQYHVPNTY